MEDWLLAVIIIVSVLVIIFIAIFYIYWNDIITLIVELLENLSLNYKDQDSVSNYTIQ
jgi:hypothetical protein